MARLMKLAAGAGVGDLFFFDPDTGDVRERLRDVRGGDAVSMGADVLTLAEAPAHLADCRRLLHEAERRRRETWAKCREAVECLGHLVSTLRYEGAPLCLGTSEAVAAADELLDRLGVETFEGE